MRVILSARAAWVVANDADVAKNVQITSMMTKKSRIDIEIYCGSGAVVLGPATSVRIVVLGAKGFRGAEDAGAVVVGAGIEDART